MRLLVLGGTAFLSRAVAEEAVRRGHDVTCACRGSSPVPPGARHVPLDRTVQDPLQVLEGTYEGVVDVATRPSWVRTASQPPRAPTTSTSPRSASTPTTPRPAAAPGGCQRWR